MKKIFIVSLMSVLAVLFLSSAVKAAEPTLQQIAAANGIVLSNETGLEVVSVVPGKSYNITLIAEYAAMADGTSGGWYIAGNTGSRTVLFTGPDSPVMTKTIKIPANVTSIGFYIKPSWYPFTNWYSEKRFNIDRTDHVVIYRTQKPDGYLIGFEDLLCGGDHDYQDEVYVMGPAAPEFAFVALPVGILGLMLLFSYNTAKKKNN